MSLKIKAASVCVIFCMVVVASFLGYQLSKPILSEEEAVFKVKAMLNIVNSKMDLKYDTEKPAEASWLAQDNFWNKATGNREWCVFIDGVAITIEADTGEFVEMVFPADGLITRGDHPSWF